MTLSAAAALFPAGQFVFPSPSSAVTKDEGEMVTTCPSMLCFRGALEVLSRLLTSPSLPPCLRYPIIRVVGGTATSHGYRWLPRATGSHWQTGSPRTAASSAIRPLGLSPCPGQFKNWPSRRVASSGPALPGSVSVGCLISGKARLGQLAARLASRRALPTAS